MSKTVILSTARTPFGKMGGGLAPLEAPDLGGTVISEALDRAGVSGDQVESVIYGQVLQAGQGQIPSRQAQIKGGIPKEVPSETVNKVCASGMRTVGLADQAIRAGDLNVGVAGGMESMSQAPYLLPGARFGFRMGDVTAIDAMTHDGLTNPFTEKQMINEAIRGLERARDHPRRHGPLGRALAPARPGGDRGGPAGRGDRQRHRQGPQGRHRRRGRRGDPARHDDRDPRQAEGDRRRRRHPHRRQRARASTTAPRRSSSPPTSGRPRTERSPLATVLSYGQVADDFPYLAKTPALAAKQALEKVGKSAEDVDLWEINEAFASVALNSVRMLGVDEEKVNVNGGAIALGHPIGASGARIIGALVHELQRRGGGLGCAAICSGGGQGDAILLEVNGS